MKFADAAAAVGLPAETSRQVQQSEARQLRPAVVQRSPWQFFRIVPNSTGTTTSTTSTTTPPGTTTTTTSTTTTSTTKPPCQSRLHWGVAVDVQYDASAQTSAEIAAGYTYGSWRKMVVVPRDDSQTYPLLTASPLSVVTNDIVLAVFVNGLWWITAVYSNCPAASVTTTTTTSTSSTTSSTTPPPRIWR